MPPSADVTGASEPIRGWTHLAPPPRWKLPRVPVPTFSVLIPAYQAVAVIGEAIESVLEQTYPAYEVIVCDDGSTDELEAALEPYRGRVSLVRQEHRGVAAARNTGAGVASGDFVVMLDSDDLYLRDRLEALGELAAARPDLDVLATDAYLETRESVIGRFNAFTPFAVDDQRMAILDRCFVGWPAIRRSRLLALGGFDESFRTGSDWECVIRLILSGSVAGLVDAPLYRYRLREHSLTSERLDTLADRVRLIESAASHPTLTSVERHAVRRSLVSKRRKLLRAQAEVSLALGGVEPRRRAVRLAAAAGLAPAERLEALLWAAAPARAARRLRRSTAGGGMLVSAPPWQRADERSDTKPRRARKSTPSR